MSSRKNTIRRSLSSRRERCRHAYRGVFIVPWGAGMLPLREAGTSLSPKDAERQDAPKDTPAVVGVNTASQSGQTEEYNPSLIELAQGTLSACLSRGVHRSLGSRDAPPPGSGDIPVPERRGAPRRPQSKLQATLRAGGRPFPRSPATTQRRPWQVSQPPALRNLFRWRNHFGFE